MRLFFINLRLGFSSNKNMMAASGVHDDDGKKCIFRSKTRCDGLRDSPIIWLRGRWVVFYFSL